MKSKFFLILFFFLVFNSYSENTIYEIGPKSENILVFTASRNQNNESTFSTQFLENFAETLKKENLLVRVIIAITDNDVPDLPETIGITEYQNTKKIISKINETKSGLVFILSDGASDKALLIPGGEKKTCPPWMLKDLQEILFEENIPFDFKYNNIILYRLGIISDDILAEYLKEDIPAIKISYGADMQTALLSLVRKYSQGISSEWDRHYNVKHLFGSRIISETTLVILIIGVTLAALFYIFVFSFLFGKKREKNIRDLVLLWRVPIFFFIINLFALYMGEYLTLLLFSAKFGFENSINFLPLTAILLKLLFAALISSSFVYINRYLKLPNNIFIYGYLASIVCFFNIFIFSRVNLSLAIIVLEIYILSFFSYHFQKLYSQIIFFILNIILFMCYFLDVLFIKDNLIDILFYADNTLAAMFILPYSLMFIRFFVRLKMEFPGIKSMSFIMSGTIIFVTVLCVVVVLIYPPFLHPKNNKEFILYNIENGNKYISVISNIKNTHEIMEADKEFPELSGIKDDDFIKVQARTENYLERVIGEVNIIPVNKIAAMRVIINRADGFPIYEANMDFKKSAEGKNAEFVSPINLTEPFSIKFSSEKNALLHVKILAWFYDNSLNSDTKSFNEKIKNDKMIFHVIKEFDLSPENGS
ncbi:MULTISPECIES: hypothetical protein [unclassified Treponema]|uniref:hypothetical protein n=1 Tax=unclassified Treponema TaxID=2638727 RepID=UPI0020A32E72|nr:MULTISPECIES: hypothetical protein [unclassified Treponema]UTC66225.1 hypothetical protein E4O06_09450 [Treponema sp. OMZ 789]UTC68954.1 hypothetical protein E4O01_09585 [Treponema sp. OMZ 790]UTC71681.1 hypothetical protein E4O02_09775 [Treponema sp. OMZ 791]